jgi:hypothetical protein
VLFSVAAGAVLGSCTCGAPDISNTQFACSSYTDCISGNLCVDGLCQPPDSGVAGTDSGADAGLDAGSQDAGLNDSGLQDAGDDAGSDAGADAGLPDYVRTGSCQFSTDSGTVDCPISPPLQDLSHTFSIFQANSGATSPDNSSVGCQLTSPSTLRCHRQGTLAPNPIIYWQTFEDASRVDVQHLSGVCSGTSSATVALPTVVDPTSTFLLKSSADTGSSLDSNDLSASSLVSSSQIQAQWTVGCTAQTLYYDVVTFADAGVTRGDAGPLSGDSLVVTGLSPVNVGTTALLFTYQADTSQGDAGLCDRILRGEITGSTTLTFSRALDAGTCTNTAIPNIAWERIDFGQNAKVTTYTTVLDAGVYTLDVTIPSVDRGRTLVFASDQSYDGQAMGESLFTAHTYGGEAAAAFLLTSSTNVRLHRGLGTSQGQWTWQVVQFK